MANYTTVGGGDGDGGGGGGGPMCHYDNATIDRDLWATFGLLVVYSVCGVLALCCIRERRWRWNVSKQDVVAVVGAFESVVWNGVCLICTPGCVYTRALVFVATFIFNKVPGKVYKVFEK